MKKFVVPVFRDGLLLLLLVFLGACATPERVARRIVTAPNVQYPPGAKASVEKMLAEISGRTNENQFPRWTIPVGPPEAEIKGLELPPGDYHVKFVSEVKGLPNGKRELSLRAVLATNAPPANPPERGTIILLPGYGTQKETMLPWAFPLARVGYRVVLLDLRGHGESTGRTFSGGKYETTDLIQVLDFLTAHGVCHGKVGVLGFSFGADLALLWAANDPRVSAVVSIAPYNQPVVAFARFARELRLPISDSVLAKAMAIAAAKLDLKWADWSGEKAVRQIKGPVLFIGGGKDNISPGAEVEQLEQAAPSGSKAIIIQGANHFAIGFWLHELEEPVKAWFETHM